MAKKLKQSSTEEQTQPKSKESENNASTRTIVAKLYKVSFHVTMQAKSGAEAEAMVKSKYNKLCKSWGVIDVETEPILAKA